jgi:flavin-dependent thymidylate synthase
MRLLKDGIIQAPYRGGVYAALDKEAFHLSNAAYNLKSAWMPHFDPAEDYTSDAEPTKHFPDYSMRITAPIPIMRQLFTHRQFDSNEMSRRYVSTAPDIYRPDTWREKPSGSIKQGSAGTHPDTTALSAIYKQATSAATSTYEGMIDAGTAPEMARFVLPQGMESTMIFTGSAMAWKRMITLRTDNHAQEEIRALAEECLDQLVEFSSYTMIP